MEWQKKKNPKNTEIKKKEITKYNYKTPKRGLKMKDILFVKTPLQIIKNES